MSLGMFAAVAAGGALGAITRYGVSLAVGGGVTGVSGPIATIAVNVGGCAIMGVLAGAVAGGMAVPEIWRGFIAIGFLGALTTFSSFAFDAGTLVARQGHVTAALYVGLSVVLSLMVFFALQAATASLFARMSG